MKTPPLLLACALLFWGWMNDAIWIAVPVSVALECSRFIRARFEFSQSDLDRIWNLCVALFVGSAVVTFALYEGLDSMGEALKAPGPAQRLEMFNKGASTAIRFLQYAPVTLLPIMLAQAFAARERFAWSTFSLWLRRQRNAPTRVGYPESPGVNVSYPYLAVVLFSACLASEHRQLVTPGLALILVWALWWHRPRSSRGPAWVACLGCAMALGLAAQLGMVQLQRLFRQFDAALMSRLNDGGKGYDPKGTRTRIGTIGGLNQSGKIILRVESKGDPPALLREASYDLFKAPMWASSRRHFDRTLPDAIDSSWPLVPKTNGPALVTVSTYLAGGSGLLPLPSGSVRLTELPVFLLQTNAHGAVQVEQGPGFVRFQAHHGDGPSLDAAPGPEDTVIPPEERDAILNVADSLQLRGADSLAAVEKIRRHFDAHFRYAAWRGSGHKASSNTTALAAFLLQHRSGHCEYFASATTLLLRAAGIPARYAVGYSVQEKKGPFYVVRGRHAHAWSLAWMNGRWQDVDATPSNWVEANRGAFWEPLYDGMSRLWFEFSKWRWGPTAWKRYLIWLILPLLGLVAARILLQKQWRRVRPTAAAGSHALQPGLDSEFYQIEYRLRALGLVRETGETLAQWFRRVRPHPAAGAGQLERLLTLHHRLRFDPHGLTSVERRDLRSGVALWLAKSVDNSGLTDGKCMPIEGERRKERP